MHICNFPEALMETGQTTNLTKPERKTRYFSESFRKQKVTELEKRITTIAEICRTYQVSRNTVYRWINKYSLLKQQGVRLVVETASDTRRILLLEQKVRELEQLVGQKQIELEFHQKMIELAEETYRIKIKKNSGGQS